jgi:hypothetical protein
VITAKIVCQSKSQTGDAEDPQFVVSFRPDYDDDRNKEWSRYTPAMSMSMTLKGAVADRFEVGKAFTLQFVEEPAVEAVTPAE